METKNVVVLVGRLVKDPELRYMPNGTSVAGFALAVNRSVRKDDGSFEDALDGYFDCDLVGKVAETLCEDFHKGALVQVTGSLIQRKWKVGNGAGSRTASKIEVKVKSIASVILPPRKDASAAPPVAAVPEQAAPELQPA